MLFDGLGKVGDYRLGIIHQAATYHDDVGTKNVNQRGDASPLGGQAVIPDLTGGKVACISVFVHLPEAEFGKTLE